VNHTKEPASIKSNLATKSDTSTIIAPIDILTFANPHAYFACPSALSPVIIATIKPYTRRTIKPKAAQTLSRNEAKLNQYFQHPKIHLSNLCPQINIYSLVSGTTIIPFTNRSPDKIPRNTDRRKSIKPIPQRSQSNPFTPISRRSSIKHCLIRFVSHSYLGPTTNLTPRVLKKTTSNNQTLH